jgi:hypothetical protein
MVHWDYAQLFVAAQQIKLSADAILQAEHHKGKKKCRVGWFCGI